MFCRMNSSYDGRMKVPSSVQVGASAGFDAFSLFRRVSHGGGCHIGHGFINGSCFDGDEVVEMEEGESLVVSGFDSVGLIILSKE